MTRLEGIRPGGRGEIASSNLSRRRATRRKKRSERGEKVRRQSGRFFNRVAGGGGERARQTLVQLVVVCVHFVVGPPSARSHSQSMCRLPRQLYNSTLTTRRHFAPRSPHVSVDLYSTRSRALGLRLRSRVLGNIVRDQILTSPQAVNFVTGLIQRRPQKPQQQSGQEETRRGRSGGWWGGRGEGGGGGSADKLTNKAILSQNRVSPPRKIRFFGGGFRIVLSEVPPPGHGPPAHRSPSPPTVRTRRRLNKFNRTEL